MSTFVAFRLKAGRDDALINWIEDLPENDRSYHIREALRSNLQGQPRPVILGPFTAKAPNPEPSQLPALPGNAEDIESALDNWIDV
jgi:hypothetical protein